MTSRDPERQRAFTQAQTLYQQALRREPNFLSGQESQEYWDDVMTALDELSEQHGTLVGLILWDDIGAEAVRIDKRGRLIM